MKKQKKQWWYCTLRHKRISLGLGLIKLRFEPRGLFDRPFFVKSSGSSSTKLLRYYSYDAFNFGITIYPEPLKGLLDSAYYKAVLYSLWGTICRLLYGVKFLLTTKAQKVHSEFGTAYVLRNEKTRINIYWCPSKVEALACSDMYAFDDWEKAYYSHRLRVQVVHDKGYVLKKSDVQYSFGLSYNLKPFANVPKEGSLLCGLVALSYLRQAKALLDKAAYSEEDPMNIMYSEFLPSFHRELTACWDKASDIAPELFLHSLEKTLFNNGI